MGHHRFITPKEAAVLLALVLALVVWLLLPKSAGTWVTVCRSGEELGRYDLGKSMRVPVQGANGFSLVVVIEDGKAWVEESTCRDLICQHHAPVSKAGESIVCLPGQITVAVKGGNAHGPDAVTG